MGKVSKFHPNVANFQLLFALIWVQVLYSSCEDGCIFPVKMRRNFSMACSYCEDNNTQLYDIDHLVKQPLPNNSYTEVLVKYGKLWTEPCIGSIIQPYRNVSCTYFVKEGNDIRQKRTKCSTELHFVCYINDTNDFRCQNAPSSTITAATPSQTPYPAVTVTETSAPIQEISLIPFIIAIVAGVVCLIGIIIGVTCFVLHKCHSTQDNGQALSEDTFELPTVTTVRVYEHLGRGEGDLYTPLSHKPQSSEETDI